jgi:hypothetical protein
MAQAFPGSDLRKTNNTAPPRRAWTGARAARGTVLFDILKMSPAEPVLQGRPSAATLGLPSCRARARSRSRSGFRCALGEAGGVRLGLRFTLQVLACHLNVDLAVAPGPTHAGG